MKKQYNDIRFLIQIHIQKQMNIQEEKTRLLNTVYYVLNYVVLFDSFDLCFAWAIIIKLM